MKEIKGDIWQFHADHEWVVIPTNGDVNSYGRAVMGRGLAKEMATKYPDFPARFAESLATNGNHVRFFNDNLKVFTFPVKHHFYERADLDLIRRSAKELAMQVGMLGIQKVYLPMVGCGNGKLKWDEVRPILAEELLDDRFIVITEVG